VSYRSPHIRGVSRLDSVKRHRCSSQDMFLASASVPMIFRFPRCMIWSKKTLSLLVNPWIKTQYTVGVMTPSSFYSLCWAPLNQPLTRVLQQTEIDGSCQTKVSVLVNTELYIIVHVRQKSRYNQLSLYQIRKIEIYLSFCKHWTEVSKFYYVA